MGAQAGRLGDFAQPEDAAIESARCVFAATRDGQSRVMVAEEAGGHGGQYSAGR